MKKITAIVLLSIMTLTIIMLTGCGNMSWGLGNFTYEKVHVDTYHNTGCYTIEKWYDGETGIEVKTKEVGSIFLSEGTYTLFEKTCPFCDTVENTNNAEYAPLVQTP